MGRITGVRRQLSKELGFVVPQVRVRDDINLAPFTYRIIIGGVVVGEDASRPTRCSRSTPAGGRQLHGKPVQGPDLRARRGLDRKRRCRCRDRCGLSRGRSATWSRRISTS
jgi:flagellar biosynthesis component FlhA